MQFSTELSLSRGRVELPIFLPVATRGFVKAVPMQKINEMGIRVLISNSVHLTISPGLEILEKTNGINGYTGFKGSYFTDSGGFQILREELVKIELYIARQKSLRRNLGDHISFCNYPYDLFSFLD